MRAEPVKRITDWHRRGIVTHANVPGSKFTMRVAMLFFMLLAVFAKAADRQPVVDLVSTLSIELMDFETKTKHLREGQKQQHVESLWREICARGDAADAAAMEKLYGSLPVSWQGRTILFVALSELWIAREIEAVGTGKPAPLVLAKNNIEPPGPLKDAPPELISAWRDFYDATRAGAKVFRPMADGEKNIETNRAEFFSLLDEFLRLGTPELVGQLAEFSPWMGKGYGEQHVHEAQLRVAFMDALRRRKLDEAVGLAFALDDQPSSSCIIMSERAGHVVRLLLSACGLDWERLFIGAIVESGRGAQYNKEWSVHSQRLAEELVVHGSPETLRLLVAHEKLRPGTCWRSLYSLIEPAPGGEKYPLHYPTSRAVAVSEEIQADLLALVPKWIALSDHPDLLETMLKWLAPLRRRELAESWQMLAGHASDRVAGPARGALLAMGIEPRPPTMVKLNITFNGAPVANTSLNLVLVAPNQWQVEESLFPQATLTVTTDKDGGAELRKTGLTGGQKRPTAMLLYAPGKVRASEMYQVVTSYWARNSHRREIFIHGWSERIPVPADLTAPIAVRIETQDCIFRISAGAERIAGRNAFISLQRRDGLSPSGIFKIPAGERIAIPGIQVGEYEATVWIAGAAEWHGGPFRVGGDAMPVEVRLDPGADVRLVVIPPGTDKATATFGLHRVDAPERWWPDSDCVGGMVTFYSLPKGKYSIQIPASADWRHGSGPEGLPPYAAREIPFEITDTTPPVLNLGRIQLDANR